MTKENAKEGLGVTGRRSARAVVVLQVELQLAQGWGPECTLGQAERQAAEAAVARVLREMERTSPELRVRPPQVEKVQIFFTLEPGQ